jgi:hypothetical protein
VALAVNTTIGSQGLPVEFFCFVELAKAIENRRQATLSEVWNLPKYL